MSMGRQAFGVKGRGDDLSSEDHDLKSINSLTRRFQDKHRSATIHVPRNDRVIHEERHQQSDGKSLQKPNESADSLRKPAPVVTYYQEQQYNV